MGQQAIKLSVTYDMTYKTFTLEILVTNKDLILERNYRQKKPYFEAKLDHFGQNRTTKVHLL